MALDTFLNPDLPDVGLQRIAREYAFKHPGLKEEYQRNPSEFSRKFYSVMGSLEKKYGHLLDELHLSTSAQLAQAAVGSAVGERAIHKAESGLEKKLKRKGVGIPARGLGLFGLLLTLPTFLSQYSQSKKSTGDTYVSLGNAIRTIDPVVGETLGSKAIENRIAYVMKKELTKEFGLDSIDYRKKAANLNYGPPKSKLRVVGSPKGLR